MGFKKNSPCNVFLIIVWSIPVLYLGRAEKPHLSEHRAAVVELSTPACNIWHATNPDDCEKGGEIQLCFCEDGMVVGEGMKCEEEDPFDDLDCSACVNKAILRNFMF